MGEFPRQNTLKSALVETEESNLALSEDFKRREDIKLYIQPPRYDDFQGAIWEVGVFYGR